MSMLTLQNTLSLVLMFGLCLWAGDVSGAEAFSQKPGIVRLDRRLRRGMPAYRTWMLAGLVGAVLLRLLVLLLAPAELTAGEQAILSAAQSLWRTGRDAWGNPWPAMLPGEGGEGLGPLMVWLTLLLQAALGASAFAVRLPVLLVSLLALWALWSLLRAYAPEDFALCAFLLCAIAPWFLLQTHRIDGFALLPHLMVIAIWLLLRPQNRWMGWLCGCLVLALCMYAGDAGWYIAPLFLLMAAGILWRAGRLKGPGVLCGLLVFLLLSAPAIGTWAVNQFDLPGRRVLGMYAPRIEGYAHTQDGIWRRNPVPMDQMEDRQMMEQPVVELVYGQMVQTGYLAVERLVFQITDAGAEEAQAYPASQGTLYLFSLPFTLLGGLWLLVSRLRQREKRAPRDESAWMPRLFGAIVISALPMLLLHRWLPWSHMQALLYPMLLLSAWGMVYVMRRLRLSAWLIGLVYLASLVGLLISVWA